ncbi:MAG: DUF4229 domain-containing protein [Streptosporangiaceae bacterium]|nr:DUF4229 domain-containing protein [Streptosporangiaceae bacterium]MBV9853446.1 DUF4229 domain-containing protein [Streptosporangiaceae bacterium]
MRTAIAYTSARILLLVAAAILLYLAGARGLLLLALAFVISGIASFVLLSRQRDAMSGALSSRLRRAGERAAGFRARLEEGARAEDDDAGAGEDGAAGRAYARAEDRDQGVP